MLNKNLIHFNEKETFDNVRKEIPDSSICFIKDTQQIYTHNQLYGGNYDELKSNIENKADIVELSNVLGKEVLDDSILEEVNILTRERIKKDLFIDLWNNACKINGVVYGRYNPETDLFELNEIYDISYEEALVIYSLGHIDVEGSMSRYSHYTDGPRTYLPPRLISGNNTTIVSIFAYNKNLQKVRIAPDSGRRVSYVNMAFLDCPKLTHIFGVMELYQCANYNMMFYDCKKLEYVRLKMLSLNIDFQYSPKLSFDSFQYMIENASNTKSIIITVHPDVFAKLTDESNTEWHQLLINATEKNIQFATT